MSLRIPRSAFTLIELLAVIVIVAILAAILIATAGHVRESVQASECLSNLRQLGQGISLYAQDNKGFYPYGSDSKTYARWHHRIYAYLDMPNPDESDIVDSTSLLFCQQEAVEPTGNAAHQSNYSANPHLMPENKNKETASLRRNVMEVLRPSQVILLADGSVGVTGATSWGFINQKGWDKSSALLAETVSPNEETMDHRRISFRHNGKTQVVFADGHVGVLAEGELHYKHFRSNY